MKVISKQIDILFQLKNFNSVKKQRMERGKFSGKDENLDMEVYKANFAQIR